MYLVVAGGSLVIGIRGRLIPQQHCTRMYVAVVGGGPSIFDRVIVLRPVGVSLCVGLIVKCRVVQLLF